MKSDWISVIPAPDQVKHTAQVLLSLARSPHDVRTAGNGNEFRIPPYLADLYTAPESDPTPAKATAPRRRTKKAGDE